VGIIQKKMKISNFDLEKVYDELKDDSITITTKYRYIHKIKTSGKQKLLSLGRIWINSILPDDFRLINEPLDKQKQKELIEEIFKKYDPEKASEIISRIQSESFKLATINPKSMSIDTFVIDDKKWLKEKQELIEKSDDLSDEDYEKKMKKVTNDLMKILEDKNLNILDVMKSGTKGGPDDWRDLFVTSGFVVDIEGNVSRLPKSKKDGFNIEEFYKSAAQARRMAYLKAVMTSEPGYLTRRLAMSNAGIQISSKDCKSKKYLKIKITPKNAKLYNLRYAIINGKLKLIENMNDYIGQELKLRSPLYCRDKKGICEVCYGDFWKNVNTKNIGLLAAGAVNNVIINVMMKSKHKSSQISFIKVDFEKITADSPIDEKKVKALLDIKKNEIFAKKDNISIIINKRDYKKDDFVEFNDRYLIPGILNLEYINNEEIEHLILPYNFQVNLVKSSNIELRKSLISINYKKGEKILYQDKYVDETNMGVLNRLFDGGLKHITDPELLLSIIIDQIQINSVHHEVFVSNMFRSKSDHSILGRLVGYKDCVIFGAKKIPSIDSWLSSLAFENIKKSIKIGLVSGNDATLNPIEKIVLDKHYKEEND
jgi:hypothetical protein